MPQADEERTTHWYYRTPSGPETGPVLMSRLRQLARQGKISPTDLVRKGKRGDWVQASTVEELPVTARANRPAVAPAPMAQAEAPPEPDDNDVSQFRMRLIFWYHDTLQAIVDRFWLIRRVALFAALVVVAIAVGRQTLSLQSWSFGAAESDPYETFRALGDEIRQKRESKAGDDDWKELSERGRREIQPLIAALEQRASSKNRIDQMLLWAGRDSLSKMFDDARQEPSASERSFDEYMRNVELLRKEQPIYGGNAGATHRFDNRRAAKSWYDTDMGTAVLWGGMFLFDAAIVVWLVRLWRRKAA
jgi:hypothetical protein